MVRSLNRLYGDVKTVKKTLLNLIDANETLIMTIMWIKTTISNTYAMPFQKNIVCIIEIIFFSFCY